MAINAIIWDLGGVLVRTNDYASRDALAARHGMTRAILEELVYGEESGHQAQLGLIDIHQHWENVRAALGIPYEEVEAFRSHFWRGDQLDGELVNFIRALKVNYRTGLLSNAFSNLRQVIQETWHIEDAFDAIRDFRRRRRYQTRSTHLPGCIRSFGSESPGKRVHR